MLVVAVAVLNSKHCYQLKYREDEECTDLHRIQDVSLGDSEGADVHELVSVVRQRRTSIGKDWQAEKSCNSKGSGAHHRRIEHCHSPTEQVRRLVLRVDEEHSPLHCLRPVSFA